MMRLLSVLKENGKIKKTNLAGKTKLNYLVCMKYVGFMKAASWIRLTNDADGEYISVSEKGREFANVLSSYQEGKEIPQELADLADLQEVGERPKIRALHDDSVILGHALRRKMTEVETQNLRPKEEFKIMVIDDEPDVALTYESFLRSEGYQLIDVFHDPEKALHKFASVKPGFYDLVITDIRMSQLNGLKLYQRIKALDPSLKVIFVTALDAVEELSSMLFPEPTGILKKPVDQERFAKYVNASLETSGSTNSS
jgi:CheY-like chemotaxis protein/predicted transcriptional regulator